jgi:hypothetical protein
MLTRFTWWMVMSMSIAHVLPVRGSFVRNDILCVNTWNATADHPQKMEMPFFGASASWLPPSCFYHGQHQRHCEQGFAVAGQTHLYFWSQDLIWHGIRPTSEKLSFASACLSGEQVCTSAISSMHAQKISFSNHHQIWLEQGECRHEEIHPNLEVSVIFRLSSVSKKSCDALRKTWKREFRSCFPWPPPLIILNDVDELYMATRMEQAQFLVGLAKYGVMAFLLIITFVFFTRIFHL